MCVYVEVGSQGLGDYYDDYRYDHGDDVFDWHMKGSKGSGNQKPKEKRRFT